MTDFASLGLSAPILKALVREGYTTPTPIQAKAIPSVMLGKDLLGIAQTGTGKTAAFALPILHRLALDKKPAPRKGARCVVLAPTRELASQIAESFRTYGSGLGMTVAVIDHMGERTADLSSTEILVLDEADQMLDLGFLQPIKRIVSSMSKKRQNLFFSATMPTEIGKLAADLLVDPVKVEVTPSATTVERIDQQLLFIEAPRKRALLVELFEDPKMTRALVFTRTKRGADRVAKYLEAAHIPAAAIHGDKSQSQRERALASFKAGKVRALIATDIAARGIDVDSVSHVIQYELPQVPESYVHRIGRTARAGAGGIAISFCADDERGLLKDIQKTTRQTIPTFDRRNDRQLAVLTANAPSIPAAEQALPQAKDRGPRPQGRGGNNGGNNRRGRPGGGAGGGQRHGGGHAQANGGGGQSRNGNRDRASERGGERAGITTVATRWDPAKA